MKLNTAKQNKQDWEKNEQRIDDLHIICPKCKEDKFYRSFGGNYTFKCVNCGYKIGKMTEDRVEIAKIKYDTAKYILNKILKVHEQEVLNSRKGQGYDYGQIFLIITSLGIKHGVTWKKFTAIQFIERI